MPSRGNPNVPNRFRRVASHAKIQKKNAVNKVSKNPRGTARSSVLHPTSGPLAPPSSKKARKLEKAKNYARQRAVAKAMAQEGEVVMTGKCIGGMENGSSFFFLIRGQMHRGPRRERKPRRRTERRWSWMSFHEHETFPL